MKELEQYEKINTESEIVVPIKSELNLIGTLKPNKGHICFEINTTTNEITEAEFFYDVVSMFSSSYERKKKIRIKEDCIYILALNKKNALKKYLQQLKSR
jgi:hypothetical protein